MGGGWQALEDVGQPVDGVDAPLLAVDDHRIDDGASPSRSGAPDEEPVLLAHAGRAEGVLDQVLVDLTLSVLRVGPHVFPLV